MRVRMIWPSPTGDCRESTVSPKHRLPSLRRSWPRWTWCSRSCTDPMVRTEPFRVCWSLPMCPTSAPGCSPVPPGWIRNSPRSCVRLPGFRLAIMWCYVLGRAARPLKTLSALVFRCSSNRPAAVPRLASAGSPLRANCTRRSPRHAGTIRRSSSRPRSTVASWNAGCWSSLTDRSRPALSARSRCQGWASTTSIQNILMMLLNSTCPPLWMARLQMSCGAWRFAPLMHLTARAWRGLTSS